MSRWANVRRCWPALHAETKHVRGIATSAHRMIRDQSRSKSPSRPAATESFDSVRPECAISRTCRRIRSTSAWRGAARACTAAAPAHDRRDGGLLLLVHQEALRAPDEPAIGQLQQVAARALIMTIIRRHQLSRIQS
jgi:hypothetical protein